MQLLAVLTFLLYFLVFSLLVRSSFKQRLYISMASLVMLGVLVVVRPFFIFFGLDHLHPEDQFYFRWGEEVAVANALLLGWFLSYAFGSWFSGRIQGAVNGVGRLDQRCLFICSVSLSLACIFATAFFVLQSGSVGGFIYQVKVEKTMGGMYFIRDWLLSASMLLVLYVVSQKGYLKAGYIRVCILFVLLNLCVIYLWGNRMGIAYFSLLVVVVYLRSVPNISIPRLCGAVAFIAFLLQMMRLGRDAMISEQLGFDAGDLYEFGWATKVSAALHFIEYDGFVLAVRDVGVVFDFRWGTDFYSGLVGWLPEFIRPDVSDTFFIGKWFRQVYQPEVENGWPITPVGSWYINFGVFGVFIGGFLTALILSFLDRVGKVDVSNFVVFLFVGVFIVGPGLDTITLQRGVLLLTPIAFVLSVARFFRLVFSRSVGVL